MRLATLLALVAGAFLFTSAAPEPALCKYCTPAPCFGPEQCNAGCQCVRSSDFDPGRCLSIE
jgi:hypothetical protein